MRKCLIIAILIMYITIPLKAAYGYDIVVDELCYKILSEDSKKVCVQGLEVPFSSLKVIIPEKIKYNGKDYVVTAVGFGAFAETDYDFFEIKKNYDKHIKEIVLPETIDSIGRHAFQWCDSLRSVNIPDAVHFIGTSAFCRCQSLEYIHLPKSLTFLEGAAFESCFNAKGSIILHKGVRYSYSVFCLCNNIENLIIEDGITSIHDRMFSQCHGLKELKIPESVTEIGKYAFNGCGFRKIELPASLLTIFANAFGNLDYIEEIICKSTTPPLATDAFDPNPNCTVYVPKGSGQSYREADGWKDFNIMEDGTTGIEPSVLLPENSNAPLYDLLGRRIYHPVKGNVYIKNGRKILW